MPTRIGNRSYPSVLSDEQRSVMTDLLNHPGWEKLVTGQPQTRIGNRTYAADPRNVVPPDETTGSSAPAGITPSVHEYAAGMGKTANDLTLPELNQFIEQYYGARPSPKQMYRLPGNY
jgi:hypothetical protein